MSAHNGNPSSASQEHASIFKNAGIAIVALLRRSTIGLIFRVASRRNFLLKCNGGVSGRSFRHDIAAFKSYLIG